MISISSQLFDLDGVETYFDKDISDFANSMERRVSSVPTLDGGSYVADQGYSATDTDIEFNVMYLTEDRINNLLRIAKYHSKIWVSTKNGVFNCIFRRVSYYNGILAISIAIESIIV